MIFDFIFVYFKALSLLLIYYSESALYAGHFASTKKLNKGSVTAL